MDWLAVDDPSRLARSAPVRQQNRLRVSPLCAHCGQSARKVGTLEADIAKVGMTPQMGPYEGPVFGRL
jgi:hypothetical protein